MPELIAPTSFYLRNKFSVYRDRDDKFWEGMRGLLEATQPTWKLVAAAAESEVSPKRVVLTPNMFMLHIWKIPSLDSLYQMMYVLSEAPWYRDLGRSLSTENQDLLIDFDADSQQAERAPWDTEDRPTGLYVYEEIDVNYTKTDVAMQRELNWFRAVVSKHDWRRVWTGRQLTDRPGTLCLLWWVPSRAKVDSGLDAVTKSDRYAQRYAPTVWKISRQILTPLHSEREDERVQREARAARASLIPVAPSVPLAGSSTRSTTKGPKVKKSAPAKKAKGAKKSAVVKKGKAKKKAAKAKAA